MFIGVVISIHLNFLKDFNLTSILSAHSFQVDCSTNPINIKQTHIQKKQANNTAIPSIELFGAVDWIFKLI